MRDDLIECSIAQGTFGRRDIIVVGFHPRILSEHLILYATFMAIPKLLKCDAVLFYDFSNYGTYDQLTVDGLTQWHPAFLELGKTLDECAKKYRGFCQRYKPKAKPAKLSCWGSKLLAGHKISRNKGKHKCSPGQLNLFEQCQVSESPQVPEVLKTYPTILKISTSFRKMCLKSLIFRF